MILVDRDAAATVHEQLVAQLRFQIVSGQYPAESTLPSTRELAAQVEVSFHTVRKAYQTLATEGLVEARAGKGFVVVQPTPHSKSERMERGAGILHHTLQELIGLGLEQEEINYLYQEQFQAVLNQQIRHKLVFASPHVELAELCGSSIASALQQHVEPVTLSDLAHHQDADVVITPYRHLQEATRAVPRSDVQGVEITLPLDVLERVARLGGHESMGIVTGRADTLEVVLRELRDRTGYDGQIIAASMEADTKHLTSFVGDVDLVLATPACRRRLKPLLSEAQRYEQITFGVSEPAMARLRDRIPQ